MFTPQDDQPKWIRIWNCFFGFPGTGKSELARNYCSKIRGKSYEDIIIWVNAQSEATMETDFQEISDQCAIQKSKNENGTYVERKKLVDLVFRHFAASLTPNPRKVLFVFDGADDVNALFKFLPTSTDYSPFIVITSQCSSWDQRFNKLELKVFDDNTAFDFFINNTTQVNYADNKEIHQLLNKISCHPLALQQAVSYITKNSITVREFITLLDQNKKEMLSEGAEQIGNPSVNTTLTISINRLKTIDPKVYLHLFLHSRGVLYTLTESSRN
ncbi:MAG: NB-ARC domain-containing protein [Cyanobacteria bacterium J06649_11]